VNSISPDGLFLRELREMLRNIISIQGVRILGADIVEIVPKKDLGDLCIRNMALITLDLIKYFITSG
jgi:arginase family enzyme